MDFYSTVTVTGGSSIDGNTASVSSPASLSPLSSWLIHQGGIDTRSLIKRDFAMLELRGDTAAPARPLAGRRRSRSDFLFNADGHGRREHRWKHRRCELTGVAVAA